MSEVRPEPALLSRYFSSQVSSARRFYLRAPLNKKENLLVVGGGYEECAPDYVVDRPGFYFPTLEFVAAGAGSVVINRQKHDLVPGVVFSYGRGCAHRIVSDRDHPLVKYFVVMRGDGAGARLRSLKLAPGEMARVGNPDRIGQVFEDLLAFGLGDRTDREICCGQALRYLLLMISELRVPSDQSAARAYATYERCRRHIETHWLSLAGIAEVADACHVDKAYLCRLFQRFGRERPFHYLQHLRMNYAMSQLQTTDRLIKDIAGEMGFADAANFTRTFRRWFGVPPQAIREADISAKGKA